MITIKEFDELNQPLGLQINKNQIVLVGNVFKCKKGLLWTVVDFCVKPVPFFIERSYGTPNFNLTETILQFGTDFIEYKFSKLDKGDIHPSEVLDYWVEYKFLHNLNRPTMSDIVNSIVDLPVDIVLDG